MYQIDDLFDRMDAWRHLPSYQLERRADLFFSLYLAEAIEARLGFPINDRILPEFPVRIGAIQPGSHSNQSLPSFLTSSLPTSPSSSAARR